MPRPARFARLLSFLLALGAAAHAATTTIWAGGFGGLYKSIDSGTTWQPVMVSVSNPLLQGTAGPQTPNDVSALALDPQQPATVYFVGEMPGAGGTGFFRSTDNGNTWTATVLNNGIVPNLFPSPYILIDPVQTNVIYQLWLNGLAKSTDYGATWSLANGPMGGITGLSIDPNASGVLYWASGTYLFKSVDFAATWTPLAPVGTTGPDLKLGNVVVDPRNSNNLYVADTGAGFCGTPPKPCGLFRSADGGQSWTNVAVEAEFQQIAFDSRTGVPYVWAVEAGVGYRVFTSTNGGNTWNPASNQPPYSDDSPIHLFSDPAAGSSLFGFVWGQNLWFKSTDAAETFTTTALPPATNLDSAYSNPALMVAAVPQALGNVSAANFESGPVAPESLVTALGFDLGTDTFPTVPQPGATSIGGTTITVVDSKGTSRLAPLLYVSPGQVDYEIPAGTALGVATIAVQSGDGVVSRAPLGIAPVAPSLFTLNAAGLAAADVIRVLNGNQTYANVYRLDSSNKAVPLPINLGAAGEQSYLVLYGTGLRGANTVSATIGGVSVPVIHWGAQGQFAGEDQVKIGPIPRGLAGSGNVAVVLTAEGIAANTVNVTIQ